MFRIIVISLLVANLLLLGFHSNEPASDPETRVTRTEDRDSNIPTIHLFNEMIRDQDLLSGNRRCFSLGPFHSSEDKDETHTRLLEVSTHINERQTQALVEKGYWVFMPPYKSMLEANEELFSLQALGLKDISVVYGGDWKNAISLGYFMRQENAARRKKNLEDRGYEPLMRVQRQAEPRYWLDYEQTPGSGLIALDMTNRPNDFMQRALPCPEEDVSEITDVDSQEPAEELAQPVESPPQKAEILVQQQIPEQETDLGRDQPEDLVQQQIPEQENDLSQDQPEDVTAAESIESTPQEAEDLVQQQIPEQEDDLAQDPAEDLTQPPTPEEENSETQGPGEDVDEEEGLDGPPQ